MLKGVLQLFNRFATIQKVFVTLFALFGVFLLLGIINIFFLCAAFVFLVLGVVATLLDEALQVISDD